MTVPVVDIGLCSECGGCVEIAPEVFQYNEHTGLIEVVESDDYPVEDVEEAIKNCPEDCIHWDE